jgi:hypothetical protein
MVEVNDSLGEAIINAIAANTVQIAATDANAFSNLCFTMVSIAVVCCLRDELLQCNFAQG